MNRNKIDGHSLILANVYTVYTIYLFYDLNMTIESTTHCKKSFMNDKNFRNNDDDDKRNAHSTVSLFVYCIEIQQIDSLQLIQT